jgi:riboflavin transporter FmnP
MKKREDKLLVTICVIAMLSAIAFVLMLLEFPVAPIPAAAHLKMDLSDIPALFGAIVYGPVAGVVIELIKNALELLIKGFGTQMGFGNLMNFIVGCAFVVPFSAIYRLFKKKEKENKGIILGGVTGFLAIVIIGLGANYVVAPLFFKHFLGITFDDATLWAAIGTATIVNAVKGLMLSIVSVPIIKGIVTRIEKMI